MQARRWKPEDKDEKLKTKILGWRDENLVKSEMKETESDKDEVVAEQWKMRW